MTFQIRPLPMATFQPLFAMDDAALAAHRGVRVTADASPGFPCRVSLRDAEPGERLILVHYKHQSADSPFRASHAVYVRENAEEAELAPGEIPEVLRRRMLSLRGFDERGMLIAADLVDGREAEPTIEAMLADSAVAYIHAHYAKPGCYAARIDRIT